MPFLDDLLLNHPKVAEKIERDAFNTRGASWGKDKKGKQKRRNRQPRWTLTEGHPLYPSQYQTYENCLIIAAEPTLQAYVRTDSSSFSPEGGSAATLSPR
jgi:hypothetical protein